MITSTHPVRAEQDPHAIPQGRADSLLVAAKRTLEMIASGASLTDILENLCGVIDAQNPDMMSTVLLADPDGRRLWPAAGPRWPSGWTRALTPLMIGPDMGSCGTAAFRKERVIISDVATDPLMSGLRDGQSREAALARGLRAAWSQPLISKDNEVLGTFGLFHSTPRSPSTRELRLIEDAGHIAVIAIEGERSRAALKNAFLEIQTSEHRLRTILDVIPTQAWSLRPDGTVDYLNQRCLEYSGLSREEAYGSGWKGEPGREASLPDIFHVTVHPEDAPRVMTKWQHEILPAAKRAEFEVRLRRY